MYKLKKSEDRKKYVIEQAQNIHLHEPTLIFTLANLVWVYLQSND